MKYHRTENAVMNKCRPTSRNKDNRKSYLRSRARELAMSGRFERWQSIEFELTFVEGLPEARTLLSGRSIRRTLDTLCREARTAEARGAPGGDAPARVGIFPQPAGEGEMPGRG
jgi:hypothetical protein